MISYDGTKCISLNNQQCITIPILIDFNPDKYIKWVRCYSFIVGLDRCNQSCNTFNDLTRRKCVSNGTKYKHLNADLSKKVDHYKILKYFDHI